MIRKTGAHEWTVLARSGRHMGSYGSEGEARERLRQVEAAKAAKGPGGAWGAWARRSSPGAAAPMPPDTFVERGRGEELPVPSVTQQQSYSCGPAALLACLRYFQPGAGLTEAELGQMAGTTDEGTTPEGLEAAARQVGLEAEARDGMDPAVLRDELGRGNLVVVALQAWADEPPDGGYAGDWSHGHYVVAVGMDGDRFTFEDPSIEGGRAELGEDELRQRWHSAVEGEPRRGVGVVVSGGRGAGPVAATPAVRMG